MKSREPQWLLTGEVSSAVHYSGEAVILLLNQATKLSPKEGAIFIMMCIGVFSIFQYSIL